MIGNFFLYDPAGDGFQIFPTMEQRDVAAKMAIENSMVDGYWSDDVLEIVVGQITGRAVKTNAVKRPENLDENSEDEEGKVWNSDMDEKHDVEIMPVNGPLRLGKRERKMSDEEFDRKIQQLRNEGYDDFADAINGLRAEITAERQASEREVADGLEFRNHIAALLPESWYTALPVEDRIRLLVEQWRKLHVSHVELTAERDGLRKQFHTQAEQRDFVGKLVDNMPHARIAAEFKEFKAEVADALATMEHALRPDLFRPGFYEAAMEIIGVTREQLGIAPGKDEASDKPMPDCPKCGNNSEVRRDEVTDLLTCHWCRVEHDNAEMEVNNQYPADWLKSLGAIHPQAVVGDFILVLGRGGTRAITRFSSQAARCQ